MEKIIKYHREILGFLIKEQKKNPELFFVPRKRNNKNRLDKGYWFLGNHNYLQVSFWNGTDWKEKIHNIGFIVLNDKRSYIELSAQDSDLKAEFLNKIVSEIGRFTKHEKKNKWYYYYEGTSYLQNLKSFLEQIKPKIDDLIKREKPYGISLLDKAFHEKYTKKVLDNYKTRVSYGKLNKITRICWNTNGWRFPSGSSGKSRSKDSFEYQYGYGNEEWLFNKSMIIDGFHYSFLEGLRVKSGKHHHKTYNITLFTINNFKKRYLVGVIKNAYCIPPEEAKEAYDKFKELGFLDQMRKDIINVKGNYRSSIFNNPQELFNVKFQFKDVQVNEPIEEIADGDINITSNRFQLIPLRGIIEIAMEENNPNDLSEGNKKSTGKRKRVFNGECEYDPIHDIMQNKIKDVLDKKPLYQKVQIEKQRVDLKALTHDGKWHFFEIKTDSPKLSIRKALGQVMEYAYYPNKIKADKLIIVSEREPDRDTIEYLNFIRSQFDIPVTYRAFDIENSVLTEDF